MGVLATLRRHPRFPGLLAATLLASCATLPKVPLSAEVPLSESGETLSMSGPKGPVTEARAIEASRNLAALGQGNVLDDYLGMTEALIGEPLIIGNKTDLLVDGPETYAAMFAAIAAARQTIDIESYIFDEVEQDGKRLSTLLSEKVAAGVSVRLLVDGVGSSGAGPALEELSSHGISTCVFNPVAPSLFRPGRLNHRDHRKLVVVDGEDSFAGGINFSRVYRSGSSIFSMNSEQSLDNGWRDTHLRIRGPGARRLGELFVETWQKQKCKDGDSPLLPTEVAKAGETVVQVIPSSPDSERNLTYVSVIGAVTFARSSIAVTMGYFVPDARLEQALIDAAGRGVSVQLILPSFSDFTGVFYAGRAHYAALLEGGVRIHEQEGAFLHAKTVVVDDIWSTIGSTNWDWRSFVLNDEISIVIIDEGFAGKMTKLFASDLENSREITPEEWKARSWSERFLERFWTGFSRML